MAPQLTIASCHFAASGLVRQVKGTKCHVAARVARDRAVFLSSKLVWTNQSVCAFRHPVHQELWFTGGKQWKKDSKENDTALAVRKWKVETALAVERCKPQQNPKNCIGICWTILKSGSLKTINIFNPPFGVDLGEQYTCVCQPIVIPLVWYTCILTSTSDGVDLGIWLAIFPILHAPCRDRLFEHFKTISIDPHSCVDLVMISNRYRAHHQPSTLSANFMYRMESISESEKFVSACCAETHLQMHDSYTTLLIAVSTIYIIRLVQAQTGLG